MSSSGEERPHNKKLKLSSSSSPCGLASLPTEIALSCLARVSRSDHASLSMVSKWHRSLMFSPELYDVRSDMGFTENCIFLCLRIPSDLCVRWFTFCPKTRNRPRPIRPHYYQPSEASSVVALGCGIYIIGGRIGGRRSSRVFFLDCRSHTWTNLPSMGLARESAAAGVVDGKIYVLGGCEDWTSSRWGEVFDPKTQTWDALPMPPADFFLRLPIILESAVVEEKVFEEKVFAANATGRGLFYIPSEGKWQRATIDISGDRRGWYVIDSVLYCCKFGGRILWCEESELERREPEVMEWREVMGLEALRDSLCASKLVNYGGEILDFWKSYKRQGTTWGSSDYLKSRRRQAAAQRSLLKEPDDLLPGHKLSNSGPNMLLFWDVLTREKLEIWCAEISLDRFKETGEIWGNIEWSEAVMTLNPPPPNHRHCKILHSLSLNL